MQNIANLHFTNKEKYNWNLITDSRESGTVSEAEDPRKSEVVRACREGTD